MRLYASSVTMVFRRAMRSRPTLVVRLIVLLSGIICAALYLLLLTQQYSGDGIRWYGIISGAEPFRLSGTNHVLYLPIARAYYSLANGILRLPGSLGLAQSMNALWGGGALACFVFILFRLSRRWTLALTGAAVLALSNTFSAHATDMTEPMPGIFWAFLAMALVAAFVEEDQRRRLLLMAAGICLGVAAACYQSNVLSVVGAVSLIWLAPVDRGRRERLVDTLAFMIPAGLVTAGLYLGAFLLWGGAASLSEALKLSLVTENEATGGIYAEASLRRLVLLVFGLAGALFGLRDVSPAMFARALTPGAVWTIGAAIWSAAIIILLGLPYLSRSVRLRGTPVRLVLVGIMWMLPHLCLLLFWGARYSKLWITPLAAIILVVVVLVQEAIRLEGRLARYMRIVFGLGLAVPVVVVGLYSVAWNHFSPNPGWQDTLDVARVVSPADLIVSSWGGAPYPVPSRPRSLSLTALAIGSDLDPQRTRAELIRQARATLESGGRVFFYDLFEIPEDDWRQSQEIRLHLPVGFMDDFERRSVPLMELRMHSADGQPLHLWRLERLP